MQDVQSLTNEDRFRIYVYTQSYLRAFENAYYQYRNGAVDEYIWEAFVFNMKFSKNTASEKAFWQNRQHIFSKEIREFYNGLQASDPRIAVAPYTDAEK